MARLLLVAGSATKIPSLAANAIQSMRMAGAFAALGLGVELLVRRGRGPLEDDRVRVRAAAADPFAFYGVAARFEIRRAWAPGRGRAAELAFALAARRLAARPDYDVIVSRNALATVLLARAGIPHLYEAHHYRLAGRVDRWLLAALRTPYVERVVLLGQALAPRFAAAQVPEAKMVVAPDAGPEPGTALAPERVAAMRAALGGRTGAPLVVYAGSLGPLKGTETLLAAARELPAVRFALVGGPARGARDRYRRRAGPNVTIAGPLAPIEVPLALAAADCLVFPHALASAAVHLSPLKLFEYLAAGRPIVASAIEPVREILSDEETALLVPPDDPGALERALARVTRDRDLAAGLAARALAAASTHTWGARAALILDGHWPRPGGSVPRLRVLHVINSFHPAIGGAEGQALALGREQASGGHVVSVLTRRRRGLPGLDGLDGVAIHRLAAGPFPLGALVFAGAALAFLRTRPRRVAFDLVHAHQARAPAAIGLLGRALGGPPFVVKLAGLDVPSSGGPFGASGGVRSALRAAVLRRADAVVATSGAMREAVAALGVAPARLHLIPNGVDSRRFRPAGGDEKRVARAALGLPAGPPVVLFAGRLERVKGADLLLEAWLELGHPEAWLLLAGDGPEGAALRARLRAGLRARPGGDRVRFAGAVADPAPCYRAADLAVIPSRSEGLSNTLLEAMASGLAVVATRVGGNAEVIDEGRTGRLVEQAARPMAAALGELLADNAARERLRHAAAAEVRSRYDLRSTAKSYERLYCELAPLSEATKPSTAEAMRS